MGKRKRLHKQAVTEGKEAPFRASPGEPEMADVSLMGRAKALRETFKRLGVHAVVGEEKIVVSRIAEQVPTEENKGTQSASEKLLDRAKRLKEAN